MDDHEPMEWTGGNSTTGIHPAASSLPSHSMPSAVSSMRPPSIEALNTAFSKASVSRERVSLKRITPVSYHDRQDLVKIRVVKPYHRRLRRVLRIRKIRIRIAVFKCGRNHYTCMSCYEHHAKRCRYCGATGGSVVQIENDQAKSFAKRSESCHKGHGLVIPNEDNFFCPDGSCGFCGPLTSVLDHVKDVHGSTLIWHFSYGDVMRIPLDLVRKFLVLRAEDDDATFVLSSVDDDVHSDKLLYVVCADRLTDCKSTKYTLDVAQEPSPEDLFRLRGEIARPRNTVASSIVTYGKNVTVREIAGANSRRNRYRIANSNLGDIETDSQQSFLVVPAESCHGDGEWYGDILLSISDASNKPQATLP